MAHEIETIFLHRTPAWHGLGVVLQNPPTVEEALVAAGLDWTVAKEPLFCADGVEAPEHRAIRRSTDSKILGVVRKDWEPVQNVSAFAWFNPFLADGDAHLESAGALREGRLVWVLAEIADGRADVGSGDPIARYLLLSNSHDGSRAVRVQFTAVRVVCANTLRAADNAADGAIERSVKILHRPKVLDALDAVRNTIDLARRTFDVSMEEYRAMARRGLPVDGLRQYVREVFSFQAENEKLGAPRCFESIERHYETAPGADLKTARGTYWGAYNAVTSYLDYERGRFAENRLESSWFGAVEASGRSIRERAHKLALGVEI